MLSRQFDALQILSTYDGKKKSGIRSIAKKRRDQLGGYEGLHGPSLLPEELSEIRGLTHAAGLSQMPLMPEELGAQKDLFPEGRLDQDLQQVDLRDHNS